MLDVDLEQLMSSGRHASGQAEDLASGFLSADNRVEAAQYGWTGASAMALNARMAHWLTASQALVAKLGDHGFAMQDAAVRYAAAEAQRAQALADVAAAADTRASLKP
ncbi:WXG100 family type VII secretion target [Mycobacterium simulans]|uniref:WXG100 family type VII secretion target n=1 Tax=Mycobacterium simulans TaxID=627089 RepID=UPI001CD6B698|nr:WXG100 family type VII secretion target [Mycobacterium simulans]